ncbi:MAG TPA: hypothetical protein VK445_01915, partial [Dissulfurispiraceae bacterium]|nr:hypothetical protein [Dissulfurispiraceae bacterium]
PEISVSSEVSELLESRLILMEDVRRVLEHAEKTGNAMFDKQSGRFIAHYRPGSVTYWVEYTITMQDSVYVLHNAYSHRMEVIEVPEK